MDRGDESRDIRCRGYLCCEVFGDHRQSFREQLVDALEMVGDGTRRDARLTGNGAVGDRRDAVSFDHDERGLEQLSVAPFPAEYSSIHRVWLLLAALAHGADYNPRPRGALRLHQTICTVVQVV